MIKMLRRALGAERGMARRDEFGVIGRVDRSNTGNTIVEVGGLNADGSWTKDPDSGHIVLTPDEREELISVLESHRDKPVG